MRRALLTGALLAGCASTPERAQARAQDAERRALAWLFGHQDADGGLRSEVYGVLKPGYSVTATVLLAAALVPEPLRAPHAEGITRAFAFLARATQADGSIGATDAGIDYPCYTSAHYLHALALLRPPGWRELADRQVAFLRTVQLHEAQGWAREDAAYGGFGSGVRVERKPLGTELLSISSTLAVLEALRAAGVPAGDATLARARLFVERCQNLPGDGGFFFTPTPADKASKAGGTKSYGTTTCDGIRALLALGQGPEAPRVSSGRAWLGNAGPERVPGLPSDAQPPLEPALRMYWHCTLARTLAALGLDGPRRERIVASVRGMQRRDGSFVGLSDLMKEDDPMVATPLAVMAMVVAMPESTVQ